MSGAWWSMVATAALAGAAAWSRGSRAVGRLPPASTHALLELLAQLRALQQLYHDAHWLARGPSFAGDHALYERLYTGEGDDEAEGPHIQEQIDGLGERIVAYSGPMDTSLLSKRVAHHRVQWGFPRTASPQDLAECALRAERAVQDQIREAYDTLRSEGALSLGLDDFLMATASERDTAAYLLERRVG